MNFKLQNNNSLNLKDHREMLDHFLEIQEEAWEWTEWDQLDQTALDLEVLTFFNLAILEETILNEVLLQHTMALE
jgi:hypothetical protein